MAVSDKWFAYPLIASRRAVLHEAERALSAMASGREPIGTTIEPSPELSKAAYGLALAAIHRALPETLRAATDAAARGGAKLTDETLQVFKAMNAVPALRTLGVRARMAAEARETGKEL